MGWVNEQAADYAEVKDAEDKADERKRLFTDAAAMYDNQLFDNCFFSPRSRKDGTEGRSHSVGGLNLNSQDNGFENTFTSANELNTLLGSGKSGEDGQPVRNRTIE